MRVHFPLRPRPRFYALSSLLELELTWPPTTVDFMMGGVSAVSLGSSSGLIVGLTEPPLRPSQKRPLLPLSVSSSWCKTRTRWYVLVSLILAPHNKLLV